MRSFYRFLFMIGLAFIVFGTVQMVRGAPSSGVIAALLGFTGAAPGWVQLFLGMPLMPVRRAESVDSGRQYSPDVADTISTLTRFALVLTLIAAPMLAVTVDRGTFYPAWTANVQVGWAAVLLLGLLLPPSQVVQTLLHIAGTVAASTLFAWGCRLLTARPAAGRPATWPGTPPGRPARAGGRRGRPNRG